MTALALDSDWRARAACLGRDTDLWYAEPGAERGSRALALSLCAGCPVAAECLADALDQRDCNGIRGGLDGEQRRSLLRKASRARLVSMTPCGVCQRPVLASRVKYCSEACRHAARTRVVSNYERTRRQ